jgi:hypothetical protein
VSGAGIIGSLRLRLDTHPQLDPAEQTTTLRAVLLGGFAEEFVLSAVPFGFAEAIFEQELRGFVITHHELCYLSLTIPPAEMAMGRFDLLRS